MRMSSAENSAHASISNDDNEDDIQMGSVEVVKRNGFNGFEI